MNWIKRFVSVMLRDRDGYISRKLVAAWIITSMVTLLLVFHIVLIKLNIGDIQPIITSDSFTTILVAIWGAYFASDSINFFSSVKNNSSGGQNEHTNN